jgi:allantoicase
MPGDARSIADGWETRRRRGPGHDWTIVRLGTTGTIRRVELDTRHFKGNAPGACSLDGSITGDPYGWRELLPKTPLHPHQRHSFEDELRPLGDVAYVRLNIFPDGGVGRLRLYGQPRMP